MQLCEYVFAMAFHYVYQTNGVLEGEDVKVLCSDPQKALTTLREYASFGVSHVKIGSAV